MSKSRHTEVQLIGALKQVEAGRTAEDVGGKKAHDLCLEGEVRRHGRKRDRRGLAFTEREHAPEEARGGSQP
jgi:hypothetical protein